MLKVFGAYLRPKGKALSIRSSGYQADCNLMGAYAVCVFNPLGAASNIVTLRIMQLLPRVTTVFEYYRI